MELTVALAQMRCEKGDLEGNLLQMGRFAAEAAGKGAGVVVFPEMCVTGYIDPSRFPEAVLDRKHDAVEQVAAISRQYGMTMIRLALSLSVRPPAFTENKPRVTGRQGSTGGAGNAIRSCQATPGKMECSLACRLRPVEPWMRTFPAAAICLTLTESALLRHRMGAKVC